MVTAPQVMSEFGLVITRQHVVQKPRMQIRTQTSTSIEVWRATASRPKNSETGMGSRARSG